MVHWTYPYSDPDAVAPSLQPMLLDQAEADRRAVDDEHARVWDSVDDGRHVLDVPLPLEAPARTSLTF